jgi:hypothetical protein
VIACTLLCCVHDVTRRLAVLAGACVCCRQPPRPPTRNAMPHSHCHGQALRLPAGTFCRVPRAAAPSSASVGCLRVSVMLFRWRRRRRTKYTKQTCRHTLGVSSSSIAAAWPTRELAILHSRLTAPCMRGQTRDVPRNWHGKAPLSTSAAKSSRAARLADAQRRCRAKRACPLVVRSGCALRTPEYDTTVRLASAVPS